MKFYYNKLILWMKNGEIRSVEFQPNKVNIITGGSETGKSSILAIIDYCFFEDRNIKITKEVINENVKWYGINFCINNNTFTIARKALYKGIPSTEYYFSSIGEIPKEPNNSISEINLKSIINKEFAINENTIVPYGGDNIQAGSKISIKYFMLFNSLDENTIDNSDTFFNRQTDSKYKEALERTFDLAVGISTEEEVIAKEQVNTINKEIHRYERKQRAVNAKVNEFEKEKNELIKLGKEFWIVPDRIMDTEEGIHYLLNVLNKDVIEINIKDDSVIDELYYEEKRIKQDIKSINNFLMQLNTYTDIKKKDVDSLKPIKYLVENYGQLINHPAVEDIINGLMLNYKKIVENTKKLKKNDFGMNEELHKLEEKLKEIQEKISKCVVDKEKTKSIFDKYIFLGEAKAKIELYSNKNNIQENYDEKIEKLKEELSPLKLLLEGYEEKKYVVIKAIEISAKRFMEKCKDVMQTYSEYLPVFNYRDKKLELMNPKISEISKVVGSSSNYLFLHLFLFLALHEVIIANEIKYIPSYIILDQPSRPYYDNKNDEFKDTEKVIAIMQLLNYYISYINKEYNEQFQMIIFEHIPKEIWFNMENVHLVEEFKNDNKLIRKCDISI